MRRLPVPALATGLLAIALAASPAHAQSSGRHQGGDREARREWMKEHKGDLKARWESLTPEQRAAFKTYEKAYRAERKSLMEQVKAGTLDKQSAAQQLKTWREANRPKQG